MKRVIIVGATGSIGTQALDVLRRHPDRFRAVALSAHRDEAGLLAAAALAAPGGGRAALPLCLSGSVPVSGAIAYSGAAGLERMIRETDADIVLNAAAGSDGMGPSFAALDSGKHLALANKETVVMAGRLVLGAARSRGLRVLPVDSEHSAIFNLVERFGRAAVRGLLITASGGAFRDTPLGELEGKKAADALAHPTWNMGGKITVDSATMANKGLEVIEAARLFDFPPGDIRVVIHPESRVHSFIRTRDGSLYAQISLPDMRIPILNALSWPDPVDEDLADLDPALHPMSFRDPEPGRYPLLDLAYGALAEGEGAACAYNAANEIAVAAFMADSLRFTGIAAVVARALERPWPALLDTREAVLATDAEARRIAQEIIQESA